MIQEYNSKNIYNKKCKPAIVHIQAHGFINFSVEAVNELNLKEGQKLVFYTDTNFAKQVFFCEADNGMPLKNRKVCKGGIRLSIMCRPLALKLLVFLKV
jgi:hypothetical protein